MENPGEEVSKGEGYILRVVAIEVGELLAVAAAKRLEMAVDIWLWAVGKEGELSLRRTVLLGTAPALAGAPGLLADDHLHPRRAVQDAAPYRALRRRVPDVGYRSLQAVRDPGGADERAGEFRDEAGVVGEAVLEGKQVGGE